MRNSFLYFIMFLAAQVGAGIVMKIISMLTGYDAAAPSAIVMTSALSNIAVIIIFIALRWMPRRMMAIPDEHHSAAVSPWYFILALAMLVPSQILEELIPEAWRTDNLGDVMKGMLSSPFGYIAIGILAPIAEEIVFRGAIMLSARQYFARRNGESGASRWGAILFTAFLFSAAHFNPAQMPHAMLIGILLGWLTVRTSSIIPAIIVHWVNNSFAFAMYQIWPETYDMPMSEVLGSWLYGSMIVTTAVFIIALLRIRKRTE